MVSILLPIKLQIGIVAKAIKEEEERQKQEEEKQRKEALKKKMEESKAKLEENRQKGKKETDT